MGTHSVKADLDVDGEVKGTSLDINGNADISGNLTGLDKVVSDVATINTSSQLFSSVATFNGDTYTTGGYKLGTSGTFVGKIYNSSGVFTIETDGDRDVKIGSSNNTDVITIDTSAQSTAFAGGVTIAGKASITTRQLDKTSSTDADADGDVVYFGSTTSMDAGKIYHYNSSGAWVLADADAESTAKGLLGVALGSASNTNGVLIRGMVTLDHDPGTIGDTIFLSTTAGQASTTAPSGNGDILRVVGYCLDSSNGQIYFNPDGTFVEITA